MLKVGEYAPLFDAQNQNGRNIALREFLGKWVLLYFYPKDDTPGCTKEACGFRDVYAELKKYAVVIGVSADSIESHKKFARKHELPFHLFSDPEKEIIYKYHAWGKKQFMGKEYEGIFRISYLINPEGKIAKVYDKVQTAKHAVEVLTDIRKAQL